MIIYSVDATTLQKGNFFNSEQILPYMLWDEDFQEYTSQYTSYSSFDYNLPLLRYYGKTQAIYTAFKMSFEDGNNYKQRIKGYKGQEKTWNNDFINAKKTRKSYEIKIDEELMKRFDSYLKGCKANDIEVIMVYAPIYIEGQEFIQNIEAIKTMYATLAEAHNFKFFDFTNDDICYDKAYFYNARHMNKTGSELFTKKLATKIKSEIDYNIAN
jgi:hypothetical protein